MAEEWQGFPFEPLSPQSLLSSHGRQWNHSPGMVLAIFPAHGARWKPSMKGSTHGVVAPK